MVSPVTCGTLRPIIIFPPDAPTWSNADVRRALLHELEHVRRYDWLVHCFTRAVCALYWFHPLVWIRRRQLSLEAERACDDAVLRHEDAPNYAEQLVALAERLARQPHRTALAMAARGELSARVRSVLDANTTRDGIRATTVVAVVVAATIMAASAASVQVGGATGADAGQGRALVLPPYRHDPPCLADPQWPPRACRPPLAGSAHREGSLCSYPLDTTASRGHAIDTRRGMHRRCSRRRHGSRGTNSRR